MTCEVICQVTRAETATPSPRPTPDMHRPYARTVSRQLRVLPWRPHGAPAPSHDARRQLRAARLADRPREAGGPVPAPGAGTRAVARRRAVPGRGPGRRDAARH